jgi:excinuclease UvrABC nuclease subunit
LFLAGKDRELVSRLQARMMALADEERFEEAMRHRDVIAAVKSYSRASPWSTYASAIATCGRSTARASAAP